MKVFVKKILIFCIPLFLYCIFALSAFPGLLESANGISIENQIRISFENALEKDYNLLILGNSKIYRGINPDLLSIAAYNFSHDNDTYNQLYYKLRYLEKKNKKYDYLVLGVDYFQFSIFSDSRNYIYSKLIEPEYSSDYGSIYIIDYIKNKCKLLDIKNIARLKPKKEMDYLKDNGQFVREGKANKDDYDHFDIKKLDVQVRYFERILKFCEEKNIQVFLVRLPLRENELKSYKPREMVEFDSFIKGYLGTNVKFLDFKSDTSYSLAEFSDIIHFNQKGAVKFSKQLNDSLTKLID